MNFIEKLRSVRKAKGMSQSQIALMLQISRQAYNNYERGIRQPDYDTLVKIADILQISLDYLLGKSDNFNITAILEENTALKTENATLKETLDKMYNLLSSIRKWKEVYLWVN